MCIDILNLLLPYWRGIDPAGPAVAAEFAGQLRQLAAFVAVNETIVFTLPGFPCKSPSVNKVLGHLPDEGERLSLTFLDRLCTAVGQVYAPGARLVICSDGHIFGDLIRVPDRHIDAYSNELAAMIRYEGLQSLSIFDLRDVLDGVTYEEKRSIVHARYAPSVEELRAEMRDSEITRGLYRGITTFLVSDTVGFQGSRSALQRECRKRAYGVIQRSRAWASLIAEHHPRSVRLSIHPQPVGAEKFGIRLLDARDNWVTPWHSAVLYHADGRPELVHRRCAEQQGMLVARNGRPSHYEIR
ncbi:MAG: L-tyrosine/L-tryptophan isonitrile synthase family protein [Longispora sp.]|nr:L-tyrosine/L-tryptophan isonitrile synthase family protein [Longispora sp. (in: high G+C Gram-positive bacteria)]